MIDKKVTLKNGLEYMVLDEMDYENKSYIMAVQVFENQGLVSHNYLFAEVNNESDKIVLSDIEDKNLYERVIAAFIDRIYE